MYKHSYFPSKVKCKFQILKCIKYVKNIRKNLKNRLVSCFKLMCIIKRIFFITLIIHRLKHTQLSLFFISGANVDSKKWTDTLYINVHLLKHIKLDSSIQSHHYFTPSKQKKITKHFRNLSNRYFVKNFYFKIINIIIYQIMINMCAYLLPINLTIVQMY